MWYVRPQAINDRGVVSLAENCVMIRYLCLINCMHLTDTSLVVLSQHCTHIETLEVAACSQFTDNGFQALARVSRQLYCFRILCGFNRMMHLCK